MNLTFYYILSFEVCNETILWLVHRKNTQIFGIKSTVVSFALTMNGGKVKKKKIT